ncbi:hypothetical protein [Marinomonas sp. 2405UD68-3]|uniref:hypothetical protein n=1 Tax=Marinomonas sp. 2405UD68-3 TaxID=3391835 RepID=UPI0039C95ABE
MIGITDSKAAFHQKKTEQIEPTPSSPALNKTKLNVQEASSASVQISDAAILKYERSQHIEEAKSFISENNRTIYEKTLVDFNRYPENLASKLDRDSGLSSEERSEAQNQLNQRELEAFGKYAKQSPPDLEAYFEHYIEYLDSLSPEEQASERYQGQRQSTVMAYERAAQENGSKPRDFSFTQDPILSLLESLEEMEFAVGDVDSFHQTYLDRLSPLFNNSSNRQTLEQEAILAFNHFERTNQTITAALAGNREAFSAIKSLVSGELEAEDFLNRVFTPSNEKEGVANVT